ncbi:MAG: molybdopterin-dependent oxidoreductase [Burkholderiales bacterium]
MREVRSTCCYCGVGCGVLIATDGEQITGVRGDPEHPANRGQLCSKGSTLHLTAQPALKNARLLNPELRRTRDAPRERATWDEALDHVTDRFANIIAQHGPDAVAFYISGQLYTEDYYVFNKLAKGLIGTINIDTNSRLCMSSAVAGYKQTLGADAPPCSYEDIDHATCLFIAGSNTAYAHPILYRRIEAARANRPDLRVIVADPRKTDTARDANLHLQILPGTDVALFNGMLHILLWEGLIDNAFIRAHTEGFDALKALARDFTPAVVAQTCGISEADLVLAAKWFGESSATLSLYCQGLNQSTSGTAKNAALINLHLATGMIGKPGTGPFSLTGQPNAMGGREVGGMANLLSAHRDLSNPAHRDEVARFWGVERVPAQPGKTAVEMFEALRDGSIKAVWIACTNPAQSMPDQKVIHEALQRAELVVLQEAYRNTETAWYADVLFPATSWGEKDGTVTNSERRITRVHAAVPAPGRARADWIIAADFARRLELRLRSGKPSLFPYATAEEVWCEHRDSTAGRDLDITGLSYALLDERGPQQWPFPSGAHTGATRLYTDNKFPTASGKAQFICTPYRAVKEPADARYPFRLTTGRLRDQWHGMSRTGTVAQLFSHAPEPAIALHPDDLKRRGFVAGEPVRVQSRRGDLYVAVAADDSVRPGQAFLAMHWGARFLAGADSFGINTLTLSAFDPVSKQPELKHAAVRIDKAALPWRLVAFGLPAHGSAIGLLDSLAPLLRAYPFASATLIGRDHEGVLLRIADKNPAERALIEDIDRRFGLAHANALRYDDQRRSVGRRIDIQLGVLRAVRMSGAEQDLIAEPWLKDWLARAEPIEPVRKLLMFPTAATPAGFVPRGNVVCGCFNVTDREIGTAVRGGGLSAPDALIHVRTKLACGTNCGSCLPEVRKLIARETATTESTA